MCLALVVQLHGCCTACPGHLSMATYGAGMQHGASTSASTSTPCCKRRRLSLLLLRERGRSVVAVLLDPAYEFERRALITHKLAPRRARAARALVHTRRRPTPQPDVRAPPGAMLRPALRLVGAIVGGVLGLGTTVRREHVCVLCLRLSCARHAGRARCCQACLGAAVWARAAAAADVS